MNEDARKLAADMLGHVREDLAKADAKANILFAAVGVLVGVLLAAAFGGDWTPRDLSLAGEIVAWGGCAAALGALFCLGSAIYPRIRVANPRRMTFFGQVVGVRDANELAEELEREVRRSDCRDAEQLLSLSRVVQTKYEWVQRALWCLLVAGVCGVAAGIIAAIS